MGKNMKKTNLKCDCCPVRGYSQEICTYHLKHPNGREEGCSTSRWGFWGAKALVGAGVGLTGVVAGMAVLPVVGAKAAIGHLVGAKIAGSGCALGAGTNVAINYRSKNGEKIRKRSGRGGKLLPRSLGRRLK